MAKKHETLTAQAEELSRKLAAARLRALLRERDRRRSGWDEGLERRRQARERLDALDAEVLAAADARATASVALADAEQTLPPDAVRRIAGAGGLPRRGGAGRSGPRGAGGRGLALGATGRARRRARARRRGARPRLADLEVRERELEEAEAAFRAAEEERRAIEESPPPMGEEAAGRRAEIEALRALGRPPASVNAPRVDEALGDRARADRGGRGASGTVWPRDRDASTTAPRP